MPLTAFVKIPNNEQLANRCSIFGLASLRLERLQAAFPEVAFSLLPLDSGDLAANQDEVSVPGRNQRIVLTADDAVVRQTVARTLRALLPESLPCIDIVDAVQRAKKEWEFVVDRLAVEIFLVDEGLRIVRLNRTGATALGGTPEEFAGKPFPLEHIGGEQTFRSALPESLESSRWYTAITGAGGCERYGQVRLFRVRESDEREAFIITRWEKTTEREADIASLRNARLAGVGEVSLGLAHEINNPLEVMWSAADALARRLQGNPQSLRYVEMIHEEINRCMNLTHTLLDFGRRPQRGVDDVNLALLLRALPLRYLKAWRMFRMDVPDDVFVSGNADDLHRLFRNLVENAIQASPEESDIRISVRSEDGHVVVGVGNEGPPIPGHLGESIFQPFVSGRSRGLGLGLALSRTIVEMARGEIWHAREGDVTWFYVRFALAQSSSAMDA